MQAPRASNHAEDVGDFINTSCDQRKIRKYVLKDQKRVACFLVCSWEVCSAACWQWHIEFISGSICYSFIPPPLAGICLEKFPGSKFSTHKCVHITNVVCVCINIYTFLGGWTIICPKSFKGLLNPCTCLTQRLYLGMQRKPFEGATEEHPKLGQAARHVPAPPGVMAWDAVPDGPSTSSVSPLMADVNGLWSPSSQLGRLHRRSIPSVQFGVWSHSRASSRAVVSSLYARLKLRKVLYLCVFQQRLRWALNLCSKQLCYYSFRTVCKNSFSSLFISSSKGIRIAVKQPSPRLIHHLASSGTDESRNLDLPQARVCSRALRWNVSLITFYLMPSSKPCPLRN